MLLFSCLIPVESIGKLASPVFNWHKLMQSSPAQKCNAGSTWSSFLTYKQLLACKVLFMWV